MNVSLEAVIEAAWESRETISPVSSDVREAVEAALELLDSGRARVAEPTDDAQGRARGWQVNQWLKKAVLLSFRLIDNAVVEYGAAGAPAFDEHPARTMQVVGRL